MYLGSIALFAAMSFQTFLSIVWKYCPGVKQAKRKTDYCDHCHLWHSQLVPNLWADLREARTELEGFYPQYFQHFDGQAEVQRAMADPSKYVQMYLQYVETHGEKHKVEIDENVRYAQRGLLKEMEGKICSALQWQVKVLKSYKWHRK